MEARLRIHATHPEGKTIDHAGRLGGAETHALGEDPLPNHVTMADLTDVPSLFRLFSFKLAVVLDVFSRFPQAARVFPYEPSGAQLADLFLEDVTKFGSPKHFVSDRGPQFTSESFRDAIQEHSVRHRFGALGRSAPSSSSSDSGDRRSLSLDVDSPLCQPLPQSELERRVELALSYYAYLRPHQALGGATPAEVFFELPLAHRASVSPPRALPREGPARAPFRVGFLDRERLLPVLLPNDIAA